MHGGKDFTAGGGGGGKAQTQGRCLRAGSEGGKGRVGGAGADRCWVRAGGAEQGGGAVPLRLPAHTGPWDSCVKAHSGLAGWGGWRASAFLISARVKLRPLF